MDNNASSSASICEIEDAMDKELGETVLRKNFQGMTNYVNEPANHLLEEINYFMEILLLPKSMNHGDQKSTKNYMFITDSRESAAKILKSQYITQET